MYLQHQDILLEKEYVNLALNTKTASALVPIQYAFTGKEPVFLFFFLFLRSDNHFWFLKKTD